MAKLNRSNREKRRLIEKMQAAVPEVFQAAGESVIGGDVSSFPGEVVSVTQTEVISDRFSGPLPSAHQLNAYSPEAQQVILNEMQLNGASRRALDARDQDIQQQALTLHGTELRAARAETMRAQFFAFGLCMPLILGGVWLVSKGFSVSGSFLGSSGIAAIITAYLAPRKYKEPPPKAGSAADSSSSTEITTTPPSQEA